MQKVFSAEGDSLFQTLRNYPPGQRVAGWDLKGVFVGQMTVEGTLVEDATADADFTTIAVVDCVDPAAHWSNAAVDLGAYIGVRYRCTGYTSGTATLNTRVN